MGSNENEMKDHVVSEWIKKFKLKQLSKEDFWSYWESWVPQAFLPKESKKSLGPLVVQNILDIVLLQSLEEFILGDERDTVKSFTENHHLSSICGEMFKNGDVFFRCDGCSGDPTCVLCFNCFKKSAHRNHTYNIGTSSGGGCCDCGDIYSWKKHPYCEDHENALRTPAVSFELSDDVISKGRLVFSAILQYCFEVTTLGLEKEVPGVSVFKTKQDNGSDKNLFCLVLQLHSDYTLHFDEKIAYNISKIKNCSSAEALALVKFTNDVGRSVLFYSSYEICNSITKETKKYSPYFKLHSLPWNHIRHQEFAMHLLTWLVKFVKSVKVLRDLLTLEMLNLDNKSNSECFINDLRKSIGEGVLLSDDKLWKSAKDNWQNVFISGMLLDYENKLVFAEKFVDQYNDLLACFREDNDLLVNSLSVQMFTVPTIAQHLISKKNILTVLLEIFKTEYNKHILELNSVDSAKHTHIYRMDTILKDLVYLLGPLPKEFSSELSEPFLNAFSLCLEILSCMQNKFPVMKDDSSNACRSLIEMKLQHEILPVLYRILDWCARDQALLLRAYKMTLNALSESNELHIKKTNSYAVRHLAGHAVECIDYDASSESVSFFFPLYRFFGRLYLHLFFHNIDDSDILIIKPFSRDLIEPMLRIQVFTTLIGYWEIDVPLKNIINAYRNSKFKQHQFNGDMLILQIVASFTESNEFLIHMLNKFKLLTWATENYEVFADDEDLIKETMNMAEKFLFILILIIGERYNPSVSNVTGFECLKYEILHRLFCRPHTHSELISVTRAFNKKKVLREPLDEEHDLGSILNEVATYHQSPNEKGIYKAKKEYIQSYNVFYYNYSEYDKGKAEEEQRKLRKQLDNIDYCPPPPLCKFIKSFKAIPHLLYCDCMLQIMSTVLKRSLSAKPCLFSEYQLQQILHLIGYALQEEMDDINLKFLQREKQWGIRTSLLQLINSKNLKIHRNFISWVLGKYRDLSNEQVPMENEDIQESIEKNDDEKAAFQSRAAERRANLLAQMSSLQQKFYKNFKDFNDKDDECANENLKIYTCILCKESSSGSNHKGHSMMLVAYVQKSAVLPEIHEIELSSGILNQPRLHINTCGHIIHYACWRENRRIEHQKAMQRFRWQFLYEAKNDEFYCPLCKRLGNSILPLMPSHFEPWKPISLSNWLNNLGHFTHISWDFLIDINVKTSTDDELSEIYCNCKNCVQIVDEIIKNKNPKHTIISTMTTKWEKLLAERITDNDAETIFSFVSTINKHADLTEATDPFSFKDTMSVWKVCAYKIRVVVQYSHFSGKDLFKSLSFCQRLCIENQVGLSTLFSACRSPQAHYSAKKMFEELISCLYNPNENYKSRIFDWECFDIFFYLIMTLPSYENKSLLRGVTFDINLFLLVLYLNFAQTIISIENNIPVAMEDDVTIDETSCLKDILNLFINNDTINTSEAWKILKNGSLSFLKCCAIFYHFLTDIPLPLDLMNNEGGAFEIILRYLGSPVKCNELLDTPEVLDIFKKWSQHFLCQKSHYSSVCRLSSSFKKLIDLPEDYFHLIDRSEQFVCSNCSQKGLKNQTLCLVCGTFICTDATCCRKERNRDFVGPCGYHAVVCGRGTGIFLLLRWTSLLLTSLNPKKNCIIPGPYVDLHGEPDHGLIRGGPLKLCKEKYFDLQLSWLSHDIPEIIYRKSENPLTSLLTQDDHMFLLGL